MHIRNRRASVLPEHGEINSDGKRRGGPRVRVYTRMGSMGENNERDSAERVEKPSTRI